MVKAWIRIPVVTLALLLVAPAVLLLVGASRGRAATAAAAPPPGGQLLRRNVTPLPTSNFITAARWITGRYDPPGNQWGDILPTVWSDDGSTYVLMDDGGVDVPVSGGLWRQSLARVGGSPPALRFRRISSASMPPARTWDQIGGNPDNDAGPLGPYYSIGFAEAGGIFYATQQRNWNWSTNGLFTGLLGIAYSSNHGKTWSFAGKPFPAPLGNLTFIDGGGPGGAYPDGYIYAIGTEREFNASRMLLGRVRTGVASVTDPAQWQWYAGTQPGHNGSRQPMWSSSLTAASPVLSWNSHITYPEMTYDRPLHRYLLTFTYSYSSTPPAVWKGGAELVIASSPNQWGPFSFVAASRDFGPSNGYGAGFPSQWIGGNGRQLWLKWAANFDGCAKGVDCSGKYGFNVAEVQLTVAPPAHKKAAAKPKVTSKPNATSKPKTTSKIRLHVLYVVSGVSLPLLLLYAFDLRRNDALRDNRLRRRPRRRRRR